VGVVLPTKDEPRWLQDETRFRDAFEAAGYDVEVLFSQGDSAVEKANVEALISKGVQVIIICPHDATAAAAAAMEAREAGIKVISYDRLIRETDAVDYYVTFDSISVGEAQAQYLVDKASGTGNPLYLYAGAATDNNAFLFFEGAWNVLQPKIADGTFVIKNSSEAVALQDKATLTRDEMSQIIGQVTTDWKFDVAKNLAEANLTAAPAADKGDVFILAPNDGTARSIADAFAADADVTSYVVTGQDAEEPSVQYIIDGKQSMTVLKDVRTLVSDAIAAAVAYLEGSTPAQTTTYNNGVIDVPAKPSVVVTVDQSNVQEAVIDSGYWPAADFTGLDTLGAPTAMPSVGTPEHPIKVLFVPSVDTQVITTGGEVMAEALNEATGLTFEVVVPTSYAATLEEMCASPTDTMAFIPALGYALGSQLCGVDVAFKAERFGSAVYWAQILVPRDSDIDSLEDLEGLKWGYGDVGSTSGYMVPLVMLQEAGVTPGEQIQTGGHNQSAQALYNGEVDFATTFFSWPTDETTGEAVVTPGQPDIPDDLVDSCALNADDNLVCGNLRVRDARANIRTEAPDVVQKLRILTLSPEIPNDTLSFGPEFPADLRAQIEDALVAFAETDAWAESIGSQDFYDWTSIQPATDEEYDFVRKMVEATGLTLEGLGQ
jgi:putative multiple sugar transport system substrate-binding protein